MNRKIQRSKSLLWERVRDGDRNAFQTLYEMQFKELYSYGLYICNQQEIVEDAIHDVFIDLYHYKEKLAATVNIKFYLFSCLRRRLFKISNEKKFIITVDNQLDFEQSADSTESSESFMITHDVEAQVLKTLKNEFELLTDHQKEIMYLRFVQDLNYEEIADIMNISVTSSRTLIYRTIKILRTQMKQAGLDAIPNIQMSCFKNAVFSTMLIYLFK